MPTLPRRLPHVPRDPLLVAGLVALGELELFSGERYNGERVWPGPTWFAACAIVAIISPLLVRRSRPDLAVVGVFGLLSAYGFAFGAAEAATCFIVYIVTAFSGAVYSRRLWLVIVAAAVPCVVFLFFDAAAEGIVDKTWTFGLGTVAILLGRAVHTRQLRIGRLQDDVTTAELRHAAELTGAIEAERRVIARELHDIVSHAVSVIVIQAQVANRALPGRPDRARSALDAIEDSARVAMVELRRLLAVFGPDPDPDAVRPVASLSQLDELLARWRAAGLQIDVRVDPLPALPAAVDLTAYRIVQESLTNTARHAPGARASVRVRVEHGQLDVLTSDIGARPAPARPVGSGRGLVGMRQRVELVGGELVNAGPGPDGFTVHARLPVAVAGTS